MSDSNTLDQMTLPVEQKEKAPKKPAPKKRASSKTSKKVSTKATASTSHATKTKSSKSASADHSGSSSTKNITADSSTSEKKPRETSRSRATSSAKKTRISSSAEDASAESHPTKKSNTAASKTQDTSKKTSEAKDSEEHSAKAEKTTHTEHAGESSHGEEHRHHRREHEEHENNRQRRNRDERNSRRRQRHQHAQNRPQTPDVTEEELAKLKVTELRSRAKDLDLDVKGMKKAQLVETVYKATLAKEGFREVEGILDVLSEGYGFIRTQGYLPSEHDVYVSVSTIRRNGLRKGDKVAGQTRPPRSNERYPALQMVKTINGHDPEQERQRKRFRDLTPIFPNERLVMEHGRKYLTARVIDLAAPIGKGQRGLIVSPPKAGKTTVLKNIAAAITANNPEVHLMCLLIDERPEEVTDMQRSIHGEVIASTFDMPSENHIAAAEMVIERAKRMVEDGEDVVILLDSITRLARAYNLAQPASGRVLSGGVDSAALYPPKRFLGAARNIEGGGSLSILASALVDTGSKMDEVIFEEFKGTGNMELKLDRNLADRRIFPAIDPVASGTRREDLLLDPQEAPLIWGVRRVLAGMNNTERAMTMLIKSLQQTEDNREFLIRTAQKAQKSNRYDDKFEF